MSPSFRLLLLLATITAALTKYVYEQKKKDWFGAFTHCVSKFSDLAPIGDQSDTNLLRELSGNYSDFIWFGLMRNTTHLDKWMWSGGGEVKRFNWDDAQPDPSHSEKYGFMIWNYDSYRWHDTLEVAKCPFFCYSAHVVREEKTWYEALEHCRKHHDDLASISSETEMMLMQKELDKGVSTAHVWTGLRFLSGDWLWLDGSAVEFEAWGSGGKPRCPEKAACGALVNGGVWEARDCEEKLHFICY